MKDKHSPLPGYPSLHSLTPVQLAIIAALGCTMASCEPRYEEQESRMPGAMPRIRNDAEVHRTLGEIVVEPSPAGKNQKKTGDEP